MANIPIIAAVGAKAMPKLAAAIRNHRDGERSTTTASVGDPAQQNAAQRAGQKPTAKNGERGQQRGSRAVTGEELTGEVHGEQRVHRPVEPLDDVADGPGHNRATMRGDRSVLRGCRPVAGCGLYSRAAKRGGHVRSFVGALWAIGPSTRTPSQLNLASGDVRLRDGHPDVLFQVKASVCPLNPSSRSAARSSTSGRFDGDTDSHRAL